MATKTTWQKISDEQVRHLWSCDAKGCPKHDQQTTIDPSAYASSGTPICEECGDDLSYHGTEILADTTAETVLREFVADVQAVGATAVREQMDWPDLATTYEKALAILPRRSAAPTSATATPAATMATAVARAEAVGLCPQCQKLPEWFNDVPLRAFCWGTDAKPHDEMSAIVPLPLNPYLTPADKVPPRILGWKSKTQMEKIRRLFTEKQKAKIERDGMLGTPT